jgi:L-aminopeptidase/D-esterase-like protein
MAETGALTDVAGFRVGHFTDREGATGCTVVLAPDEGAVGAVDVRSRSVPRLAGRNLRRAELALP